MIPALSIRQPWAWLIVNGYKDIENRDWPTTFRGNLLVHAGITLTRKYYNETCAELDAAGLLPPDLPSFEAMLRGGFVGRTHIVDCIEEHASPWKQEGTHGFVLEGSEVMDFVPYRGRLGFFNVPNQVIEGVTAP